MHFTSSNFSSAHFLDFESLHGHNFKIKVFFNSDFENEKIEKYISEICNAFDHKILIPENSKKFKICKNNEEVIVGIKGKKYVFPKKDVIILPIEDTTVELIAEYIYKELKKKNENIKKITLEENNDSAAMLDKQ